MDYGIRPTVGRTVHYVLPDGLCRAAFVSEGIGERIEGDMRVNLRVLLDSPWEAAAYFGINAKDQALVWERDVPYDENNGERTWHWPERVP